MTSKSKTVLAIDIGGTKTAAAAVSANGEILCRKQIQTPVNGGPEAFLQAVADVATSALREQPCEAVGVASAGPLDPVHGILINPTNIKGDDGSAWGTVEILRPLQDSLNLPVTVENDAACAVLAEDWIGTAKKHSSSLVMTLGTGVGIGVISDGRLLRLRQSFHPEASHFSLNFTDMMAPCGCGNYGCVEAYLGGKNFIQYCQRKWNLQVHNGEELKQLAIDEEPTALQAFEFYSEVMAQALNAYAVLFGPEVVIFSGGFSHNFEHFQNKTLQNLKVLLRDRRDGLDFLPKICVSQMQDDAGLLGAARVALEFPNRF
jgi:glucokinase